MPANRTFEWVAPNTAKYKAELGTETTISEIFCYDYDYVISSWCESNNRWTVAGFALRTNNTRNSRFQYKYIIYDTNENLLGERVHAINGIKLLHRELNRPPRNPFRRTFRRSYF